MPGCTSSEGTPPWRSFWMAGFEGADHVNGRCRPLDMAAASGHLDRLNEDYARAAALGFRTVRESVGWRLGEPAPGRYALERVTRVARVARRHGVQVLWTLMHYGVPQDLTVFHGALAERFAAFARAVAERLAPYSDEAPVYTPVNEISFTAWAATHTNIFWSEEVRVSRESTMESGYEVKCLLVRAALAAMHAIREADPRARFLHVEPLVHAVPPRGRDDLEPLARQVTAYQWQAWDMLAGRLEPGLGGADHWLDCLGVNHYHSGQWEVGTERRLDWHVRDGRRRPLSGLLGEAWRRYRRPLVVSETSHVGAGRAPWLHEVAREVRAARNAGVPVGGLCLYPFIDRPDWDDPAHWHRSGVFDVMPSSRAAALASRPTRPARHLGRARNDEYARAIALWQRVLPSNEERNMSHLIVFCHLRWDFVFQRPQQVLSRIAAHHHVLFVEEPVYAEGEPRLVCIPQAPGVDVLRPHTPVRTQGFHDDQLPVLQPLLEQYLADHAIDDYAVWMYTPMALPLVAQLRPRAVVYDCMDELSAFKDAPRQLRQRESALLKMADVVFTGGPALYEAKRAAHSNTICLPSGVDSEHFAPHRLSRDCAEAAVATRLHADMDHPRFGYFGVIDERLDTRLIAFLADARPHWQFVMVGPVVKINPALLPRRPNLYWVDQQPYAVLPHLLAQWDVALLPFALNEATRYISPTKTLEYMAGGKPVVSTAIGDVVRLYGSVVRVARDHPEFLHACEAALRESPEARALREEQAADLVAQGSWDAIAGTMRTALERELALTQAPATAPEAVADDAGQGTPVALDPGSDVVRPAVRKSKRQWRHIVIGAGPTGLAAAYHLGRAGEAANTLLLERERRVGGWCRSVEVEGFTFDHAGHIMFSNDPEVLDLYERLLGDNLHWQNREAWIYSKGVHTRYPFQGSLYGLPPDVLKECLVGAIEARFGPLRTKDASTPMKAASQGPANFEEFIHRIWGSGIAKHFALPYNRKLWTVPLAEMETSWLEGRVPLPDLEQVIEGALEPAPPPMGPNARFGYPLRGGFQALMDGFLPLLDNEVALGTGVLHISPSQRTVRLDDGRVLQFETLVSTMPLPRLVEACGDEAPPEIRAAAAALRHVSVRCVNLGVGRPHLTDKHWIYYPEDTVFHRIFAQGNVSPHVNPPGGFGLTCEITYSAAKPLPCEGQALVDLVVADCRRVGMLREDDPILVAHQADLPCAYVVYDHHRAANVDRIRRWLDKFSIVLAGRYSEWEYYNSDHAFVAGKRAAAMALARLATAEVASA